MLLHRSNSELDSERKLFLEIALVAANGKIILTDALLDTGFADWLAMNERDIESLGWSDLEERPTYTTQRETRFNVYVEVAELDGQVFDVPVLGGDTIFEVLFGLSQLRTRKLILEFPAGVLME